MFGPDTRLIFCNRRYAEIYGVPPEAACPGVTLRALLDLRLAASTFSGDPDEYVAELLRKIARGKTTDDTVDLADGRRIRAKERGIGLAYEYEGDNG